MGRGDFPGSRTAVIRFLTSELAPCSLLYLMWTARRGQDRHCRAAPSKPAAVNFEEYSLFSM